jgi:hypothetical protein
MKSLTTPSWMFQVTQLKTWTQQLIHDHQRNQANQRQLQPFFIMSPSDLLATQSSECLQERCPRHRHWETYENKTNLKQLTTCKQCYPASAFTQDTTQTQNWSQNLPFQDNPIPSCLSRHCPLLNSHLNSDRTMCKMFAMQSLETSEPRAGQKAPKRKTTDYSLSHAGHASGSIQIWSETSLSRINPPIVRAVLQNHVAKRWEGSSARGGIQLPCRRHIPHTTCAFIQHTNRWILHERNV